MSRQDQLELGSLGSIVKLINYDATELSSDDLKAIISNLCRRIHVIEVRQHKRLQQEGKI